MFLHGEANYRWHNESSWRKGKQGRFLFKNDVIIFAPSKGVTHHTASEIIPFLFSNKGTWAGHAAKGNKVYCIVMTNAIVF
jgi:hypothetical protein